MRAIIQRVGRANVSVNNKIIASIDKGLLIFLGVEHPDTEEDLEWLSKKILQLRIFGDQDDKMNLSVCDIKGQIIVVSQFTLHASTKKGNRPSFIKAAKPDFAKDFYLKFVRSLKKPGIVDVQMGKFCAMMDIELLNDGPVTMILER